MVTVAYEQARSKRKKHQRPEGYEVSSSKTIVAPLNLLYMARTDEKLRARGLQNTRFAIRKETPNKSLRINWTNDGSRVESMIYTKGARKSQVTAQHRRLPSALEAEKMKTYRRARLVKLQDLMERKLSRP
jgi:hypothetical protein